MDATINLKTVFFCLMQVGDVYFDKHVIIKSENYLVNTNAIKLKKSWGNGYFIRNMSKCIENFNKKNYNQ